MTKLEELIEELEKCNSLIQDSEANNHYKQGYNEAVEKFIEIADDIYEQDLEVGDEQSSSS